MRLSKTYGKELILDLHECDPAKFNRRDIEKYFVELCALIRMKRADLHWWDDYGVPADEQQTEPHLKGTSAVQFIMTSNIVIHTLDLLQAVYINVFSCKEFDTESARQFSEEWFKGRTVACHVIERI